jgi:hypothetical protein
LTANFNASVVLAGIKADSITVDSANQVTATFTKGVPPLSNSSIPELLF